MVRVVCSMMYVGCNMMYVYVNVVYMVFMGLWRRFFWGLFNISDVFVVWC